MDIEDLLIPTRVFLICLLPDGQAVPLGVFFEEPCHHGRRLIPSSLEAYDRIEHVKGQHWLGLEQAVREDHPEEVIRLRKRFLELLEESQCLGY